MLFNLYKDIPVEIRDKIVCTGEFLLYDTWATISDKKGNILAQLFKAHIFEYNDTRHTIIKVIGDEYAGENGIGVKIYFRQTWILSERIDDAIKSEKIKLLTVEQRGIFADIIRIQRSIAHHTRLMNFASKQTIKYIFNPLELIAYFRENIQETILSTDCELCKKYIGFPSCCFGCPLKAIKNICNSKKSAWSRLYYSHTLQEFAQNEKKYMIPALKRCLSLYQRLLKETSCEKENTK